MNLVHDPACLSIALYILSILLPIIPAVIIYRLCPTAKISVSGPLAGLTVRATGAIGAYLAIAVLVLTMSASPQKLIAMNANPTWTVRANIILEDYSGRVIDDPRILESLKVGVTPDLIQSQGGQTIIKLPGTATGQWPHPCLTFEIPRFGMTSLDIAKEIEAKRAKPDEDGMELILSDIVICQSLALSEAYVLNLPLAPATKGTPAPPLMPGSTDSAGAAMPPMEPLPAGIENEGPPPEGGRP